MERTTSKPASGMTADPAQVAAAAEALRRIDRLVRGEGEGDHEDAFQRLRDVGGTLGFALGTVRCGSVAGGIPGQDLDPRWHHLVLAGISGLVVTDTCDAATFAGFVRIVASTRRTRAGLASLRRALWADAFPGFVVQFAHSHADVRAAAGEDALSRADIDARRTAAVQRALDAADAPLETLPRGPDRGLARALRVAADSADFWLAAEAGLLDGDEALRARADRRAHGRWLRRTMAEGPTLRMAGALTALHGGAGGGNWSSELARELSPRQAGRIIGRHTRLDAESLPEIEALLGAGDAFAGGLASGLLERGGGDQRATLAAIVQRLGLERLWELASLDGIDESAAHGLALVLREHDAAPQLWADLVGWAPPRVAAWILRSAPKALLGRLLVPLRRSLRENGIQGAAPLLDALVGSDDAGALAVVGEVLMESRGAGLAGRSVPEICTALVRHGHGKRYLVPLVLDRAADLRIRSTILRALYDDPEALEEASRFRVTEMMEPKELQDRLKAARKHAKTARGRAG